MTVSKELILREVAGEYILVPTGSAALKVKGMINLTESGHLLWQKLQQDCTEADLIEEILKEYDVDKATASADVAAFVNQMRELELLVEA